MHSLCIIRSSQILIQSYNIIQNSILINTIADAKEPLKVKWYTDSFVEIPVLK